MSVVLKWLLLTGTDVLTTCAVVIFRVKVSCIKLVDGIENWLLTSGQWRHDVIGPLSVKLQYYWLWRLLTAIGAFWSIYLSQFNSCLLLVKLPIKLSIIQSFRHCQFAEWVCQCRSYSTGNNSPLQDYSQPAIMRHLLMKLLPGSNLSQIVF